MYQFTPIQYAVELHVLQILAHQRVNRVLLLTDFLSLYAAIKHVPEVPV